MQLDIQTHTDQSTLLQLHREWNELLLNTWYSTIFQTPEFYTAWWDVYGKGNALYIISVWDETTLVGLAPLYQNEEGALNFLGDRDITDYQDIIAHHNYQEAVFDAVFSYLAEHHKGVALNLFSLLEHAPLLTYLEKSSLNWSATPQPAFSEKESQSYHQVYSSIKLPNTWEKYLESLERKQRHEVRRKYKKLRQNLEHSFEVITATQDNPQAVAEFITLHKLSAPYKAEFWDAEKTALFQKLLQTAGEAGYLKLFFLKVEGQPVASMLIFDVRSEYQLYNSGYNSQLYREYSTGQVLTSYTIRHAIEQGKRSYSFLRGNEEYKFRLGAVSQDLLDVTVAL
ncbi:MAG: GNAT family N-acetyltransferase [Pseudomonadales bacterium]|nr:GNAT family N-acetyltransferase [Pseudomonadales bacterium]